MKIIRKQFIYNSGTTKSLNILLTENIKDMGFFDTLDDLEMTGKINYADAPSGYTFINVYDFSNYSGDSFLLSGYTATTVTGYSSSRLGELEKYVISNDPMMKYFTSGNSYLVSYTGGSTGITYIYHIEGINYSDIMLSGSSERITSFSITYTGYSGSNFDNKRIIKLNQKENMVENPQVGKDVFITRQQQPVFEKNYRLRGIGGLSDIISYAGGNYFKIYNNT